MTAVATRPSVSLSTTIPGGYFPSPTPRATMFMPTLNGIGSVPSPAGTKATETSPDVTDVTKSALRPATGRVQKTRVRFAPMLFQRQEETEKTDGTDGTADLAQTAIERYLRCEGLPGGPVFDDRGKSKQISREESKERQLPTQLQRQLEFQYHSSQLPSLRLNYHPTLTLDKDFGLIGKYGEWSVKKEKSLPELSEEVKKDWRGETFRFWKEKFTTWEEVVKRNSILSEMLTYQAACERDEQVAWAVAYLAEKDRQVVLSEAEKTRLGDPKLGDPSQWHQAEPKSPEEFAGDRKLTTYGTNTRLGGKVLPGIMITPSKITWAQIAHDMEYSEEKTKSPGEWQEEKTRIRYTNPKTKEETTTEMHCVNYDWFKTHYQTLNKYPSASAALRACSTLSRNDSFELTKKWLQEFEDFNKKEIQLIMSTKEEKKAFETRTRKQWAESQQEPADSLVEEAIEYLASINRRGCAGNCNKPWCGICGQRGATFSCAEVEQWHKDNPDFKAHGGTGMIEETREPRPDKAYRASTIGIYTRGSSSLPETLPDTVNDPVPDTASSRLAQLLEAATLEDLASIIPDHARKLHAWMLERQRTPQEVMAKYKTLPIQQQNDIARLTSGDKPSQGSVGGPSVKPLETTRRTAITAGV